MGSPGLPGSGSCRQRPWQSMKLAEGKGPWDVLGNVGPSSGMPDPKPGIGDGSTDRATGRCGSLFEGEPHCLEAMVELNTAQEHLRGIHSFRWNWLEQDSSPTPIYQQTCEGGNTCSHLSLSPKLEELEGERRVEISSQILHFLLSK